MAKRTVRKDDPLNLVPIMNLVTILIPVLLVAVKAVTLAMIESKLPAISNSPSPVDSKPEEPPLALKLIITQKGISINKESYGFLWPEGTPPQYTAEGAPPVIPCRNNRCENEEDYKFDELTDKLRKIRAEAESQNRFEDSSTNVVLLPEKFIPYRVLVRTMDAARGDSDNPLFPVVAFAGGLN